MNSHPGKKRFSDNPCIDKSLNDVVDEMRTFIEKQAQQIDDLAEIGKAMSTEHNPASVLEMILTQARKFTAADAGTLYLLTEDRRELVFHVVHNDTLNIRMGGISDNDVMLPGVSVYDDKGNPNHAHVSAYAVLNDEIVNIADVYDVDGFNFEGVRKFDALTKYHSESMLVVPMKNHEDEIIGVLQLINAKNIHTAETIPFGKEMVKLVKALASQAAVVLTQQQLISDLKNLFESFLKSIAVAIEEKSKYTGGHIRRVTELTMRMAEKINAAAEGPFQDVCFDCDQMNELRIAAWMHDIGKIITPEHVVDKANKLETIFNRIELIKTRWQAIRFSRLLAAERAKVALAAEQLDSERVRAIDEACAADLDLLNEELRFIEDANKNSESFADDQIERLHSIARKCYTENGSEYAYLSNEEVENLSIRKGTLTAAERQIINNHALMTQKILQCLPWPRKMEKVPEIAAAHHERLDGSGYPLGLKGDQICLQSRIMAVADIFEALSARDRPYKKPMPLSQAIKILGFMAKDNHIDKDIVDFFIRSGLVCQYAQEELNEE